MNGLRPREGKLARIWYAKLYHQRTVSYETSVQCVQSSFVSEFVRQLLLRELQIKREWNI